MRSRFTPLAVVMLCLASVPAIGCGGERAAFQPRSPASAAYPPSSQGYPRRELRASERAVVADSTNRGATFTDAFDDSEGDRDESPKKASTAAEPAPAAPGAGGATGAAPGQPPPPPSQATPPSAAMKAEKPEPTAEPAQNRDFVIYTARFTMAVYQVDQGLTAVEKIARDNGGYLGQKKDREITVRIPRGRFETTLAAIDRIGDVLHREIQAQDVTEEHVDLEVRIKNARAMQRRLSDLLSRASVKDALEIEKELHRVTEELERLEGRMKVLKDRIAFSTITVAFEPRGAAIVTTRARLPFPWLGALNLPSLLSLSEEK
jgi:Domain of unknown function (DUF4349)